MNEMTRQEYDQLKASIEAAGFFAIIEADPALDTAIDGALDHRVVCASKRRQGGGYCGTSFWISFRSDSWFLGTWGSMVYLVPDSARVVDLCVGLLETTFTGPMHYVPAPIRQKFAINQVEDLPDETGAFYVYPTRSQNPEVVAAINELDTLYVRFLEAGLLVLRTAIYSGDPEWSKAEVELLHNVPSLIDEHNIERHRYFWISERELYLSRLSAHGGEKPMMRMQTSYEPLWKEMEPVMLRLLREDG